MTTKKLNKQQAWWAETLAKYDFIIQYCKEKNNSWADILSRRSDFIKKVSEKQEQTILQANQNKQLKYAHCRIIQTEKFLNEQIRKEISKNKFTKKIIKKINKYFKMKIMKKLLLFQELIYVSSATRKEMIQWYHDNVLTEHFRIDKIIELIFRNYYFSQIWQKVEKYI